MLGARIVVEQSSVVNETHLLTPKSLTCSLKFDLSQTSLARGDGWRGTTSRRSYHSHDAAAGG